MVVILSRHPQANTGDVGNYRVYCERLAPKDYDKALDYTKTLKVPSAEKASLSGLPDRE